MTELLNPLFGREWRGRFRRFNSLAQLAILPVGAAGVLTFLMYDQFTGNQVGVAAARSQGAHLLHLYQALGGALLFVTAWLIGAMSILSEKQTGAFEQLQLCPFGARGIVVGKICSGAAFLLMLQMAFLPLLAAMCPVWLLRPSEFGPVVLSHILLTFQGLAMGMWGAMRAYRLSQAIESVVNLVVGVGIGLFFLVAYCSPLGYFAFQIIGGLFYGLGKLTDLAMFDSLLTGWHWIGAHLFFPIIQGFVAFVSGYMGLSALFDVSQFDHHALFPCLAGQLFALSCLVRWSGWELSYPDRSFVLGTRTPITTFRVKVLLSRFSWTLSLDELSLFPIRSEDRTEISPLYRALTASPYGRPKVKPVPKKAAPKKVVPPRRVRLVWANWARGLNPVLWLDLQRCLSLKAPNPAAQLPLLLFLSLGGSIAGAIALFMAVSLSQSAVTGSYSDVSSLHLINDWLRGSLCYVALACGPIFCATGYVIERRTYMLHELRLTLLSARALWIGKLGARGVVTALLSVPTLAIVAFFTLNSPAEDGWAQVGAMALLTASIAAWSLTACLWLSYHTRNELVASMWTLGLVIAWGGLFVWKGPLALFPTLHSVQSMLQLAEIHAFLALFPAAHLFYRLKRFGFG